jgi:outer membrane protein insertion porin family
MNRSFSILIIVVLLMLGIAGLTTALMGQVEKSASLFRCDGEMGRPTLQRRQPAPDSPAANGNSSDQKLAEKEKCKPQSGDTVAVNDQNLVRIEFEGLHALSESDLLKCFRERGVGLSRDRFPDSRVLTTAVAATKDLLEAHGYLNAAIEVLKDEHSRTVMFRVKEGARLPIAEIRFDGNVIFSSPELAMRIGECLQDYEASQNGYDREIFESCQRQVTNFVRSGGYLQAKFDEAKKSVTEYGLVFTIPVEEGILYRVGRIKIEGAEALSSDQLRASSNLRPGDIANGEAIGKWLYEDLKRLYGDMGYIQYTAELIPEFKMASNGSNEGIVDCNITIDEGRQFRLRSIRFQGKNLPETELRKLLLIREGDIFSQRWFEKSVDQLNDTERFEFIDKDKDSDFKTSAEEGLVDIVIKITERPAPPFD